MEEGSHSSPSPAGTSDWDKKLFRTLCLVNLASVLEKADEVLLPVVYGEVGVSLHASLTRLGSLALLQSLVQTFCFPLAAYMSVHHDRSYIIALGALLWAIATFCIGASTTFVELALSKVLNGLGLAIAIPAIRSLVADATNPQNRGLAFGWLLFTGYTGAMLGAVSGVLFAGTKVFGLAGWRVTFHITAAASVVVALLVYQLAIDPRFKEGPRGGNMYDSAPMPSSALEETLAEVKTVLKIPSFIAIVAQGVAGTFSGAALSFCVLWLELIGFSHTVAAAILGFLIMSVSLGGLCGGWLGDIFAKHLPNAGRIILAQFGSGIGILSSAVLLLFLPYDSSTALLHGAVFSAMGFFLPWCVTATNNPIFAEIVPEKLRTSIYALDQSFETLLASFAPLIVGILAEHVFGYIAPSDDASVVADTQNAIALGKALYVAFAIPCACCCLLYSVLYWTYPKDKDKAQLQAELHANEEGSPVYTDSHDLNPYVRLSEESDAVGANGEKRRDTYDLKSSGGSEHLLSRATNTG